MALAFLAISSRERGSVTTQTDTTTARLAADAGLADAEAQIAANILTSTNPYSFGLLVSTNYLDLANARGGLFEQHRHARDGKPLLPRPEPQRHGRSERLRE